MHSSRLNSKMACFCWFTTTRGNPCQRRKRSESDDHSCFLQSPPFCYLLPLYNPLLVHILYFISLSSLGFLVLRLVKVRTPSEKPKDLDFFFTSVSAATVSSMATVEMEVFSNSQLVILTVLMLVGGEVFTSMVGLQFRKTKLVPSKVASVPEVETDPGHFELGLEGSSTTVVSSLPMETSSRDLIIKFKAIRCLRYVVMFYFLVIHVLGTVSVLIYTTVVSSARNVLKQKGIKTMTFAVFTTVSSFSNCGFLPTNENMVVFSKNTGLLLLIIPQILTGNTLFPPCLRLVIWVLRRFTRREEFDFLLKKSRKVGYYHLLPGRHSLLLAVTVGGFLVVQLVMFCAMQWRSGALSGMSPYQKIVGGLFLAVNARHAGESIVDLSSLSSAVLVLYILMMYLPPYTSFMPIKGQSSTTPPPTCDPREDDSNDDNNNNKKNNGQAVRKSLVLSQLSYLVISIILVCITERRQISEDPLNFNVLSITLEVISAYGNVGFSMGYSCGRRLRQEGSCKDTSIGLVGRWSTKGKIVLIFVMFFGRLKKFNMRGGQAWMLS